MTNDLSRLRSILFVFAVLATPSLAHAGRWSELIAAAADACGSNASALRTEAADCRALSTPPEEGGESCTGLIWRETTPDGITRTYRLSIDEAEALAERFDRHSPTLDDAAHDVSELEDAASRTQDEIRKLGFEKRNEDYEAWLQLAESSRDELGQETRAFLVGRMFDGGARLTGGIATLSRGRADKMARALAHYGDSGVLLGKRLKRIARISGRRARAEAAEAAIESLQEIYDQATSDGDLEALASALSVAVEVEGFGFLLDELKWTTAAVYAYAANAVAEDQIDRLTEMQVLQLRALKSLIELLERQVSRIDARVSEVHHCSYVFWQDLS